ncbi:HU family DNA-binding protein [Bacteroides sp. 51]|uniref:HU family DNA-binding protein n=1 Tax=Bacteroides sp. 51 TaxID=2302938 RepID=UPI0013D67A6E|nr:HU family DNA-binding protein [Bacteroides sp. 51]NDV83741.1 hypothetical protein [Bacteroides sp. 51]
MSDRLNTQDLIDLLINHRGIERKEAENFVKEFFALIEEGLEKDRFVKIKGFGTFKLVDVESRESVNVNTGERIEIQGHTKISFTPDTALRDIINKPFAHFETVVLNEGVEFNDITPDNTESLDSTESNLVEEKITLAPEEELKAEEVVSEETIITYQEEDTDKQETEEEKEEEIQTTSIPEEEIEENKENEVPVKKTLTIEEIIAAERLAPPPATPTSEKENDNELSAPNNKVLTIVVILTILLCGILLFFTYYEDIFPEEKKQPVFVIPPVVENTNATTTAPIVTDSMEKPAAIVPDVEIPIAVPESKEETKVEPQTKAKPDEVKPEAPKVEKPVVTAKPVANNATETDNSAIPFAKIPVKPDSTSYEIIGTKTTHTIKEGETLIRISYNYYGTKDLYPYLIKHNRSVIKNPNSVPLGTTINIPELKKK